MITLHSAIQDHTRYVPTPHNRKFSQNQIRQEQYLSLSSVLHISYPTKLPYAPAISVYVHPGSKQTIILCHHTQFPWLRLNSPWTQFKSSSLAMPLPDPASLPDPPINAATSSSTRAGLLREDLDFCRCSRVIRLPRLLDVLFRVSFSPRTLVEVRMKDSFCVTVRGPRGVGL